MENFWEINRVRIKREIDRHNNGVNSVLRLTLKGEMEGAVLKVMVELLTLGLPGQTGRTWRRLWRRWWLY